MSLAPGLKELAICAWLGCRITLDHNSYLLSILPFFEQKHLLQWPCPYLIIACWVNGEQLVFSLDAGLEIDRNYT